ncbi:hypothetical protein HN873_002036, partial [Arachis hypogaea]
MVNSSKSMPILWVSYRQGQIFPNPVEDPAFSVFVQGYAGVILCDLPSKNVTEAHCKFFLWVDDHIVRVRAGEATRGSGDGKQSDVGKHLGMDNLIDHVEERIAKLEKLLNKKSREVELRKKAREAAARDMEASSTT